MTEKIQVESCPSLMKCSAPLCPLDPGLNDRIWYPDEPVCVREGMIVEYPWLNTQKKIAKKTRRQDLYYTGKMIKRNCIVGRGMAGIDSDREEEPQINRWFRNHPKITEKHKILSREKIRKGRMISEGKLK